MPLSDLSVSIWTRGIMYHKAPPFARIREENRPDRAIKMLWASQLQWYCTEFPVRASPTRTVRFDRLGGGPINPGGTGLQAVKRTSYKPVTHLIGIRL